MIYTAKMLMAELKKLAEDNPDVSVVVIEERKRESERQERQGIFSHNPVIDVARHGNTIMLTYRA